uniref:Cytochrome b561 domain-containing protein n=1 Tax=Panagrellus redivivus TaxID=6233 RepID=A0A7E4VE85_PANRE
MASVKPSDSSAESSNTVKMVEEGPYTQVCTAIYGLQKLFALGMFVSLFVWIFAHAGGIGMRDEPTLEFNIHPMMMSIGMLFFNGEAITVYRGVRQVQKKHTKLAHMIIQIAGLVLITFGLITALDSHNYAKPKPIPNFMSFHSWLGILTISLFSLQLFGGIGIFALPYASMDLRKKTMPIHRISGVLIFVLAFASSMLGYSEKAAWAFKCWTANGEFCAMVFWGNMFALCMSLYALCVLSIVINPEWIRKPLPSETHVPLVQRDRHE